MLIHKAIVLGGSGLVGTALLNELVTDSDFVEVHALGRKPLPDRPPRIREHVVDFDNIEEWDIWSILDGHTDHHAVIFCCLGTTRKVAGSVEEYRRIDHDIPLAVARIAHQHGARHFIAISGASVTASSRNHFDRTKADLESDLSQIGYHSLTIVRPSLLLGKRKDTRWLEVLMKFILIPFSFIIPPRWRAVHDWQVAQAMITFAMSEPAGIHYVQNEDIVRLRR